jgi:hypothetical protein
LILLISCLGNKTNNPNVKMNYKDYERVIQGGLGWTLVSWPEGTTFAAPSNFKAGGVGYIVMLWQRLKSGACCFEPTDPALQAEILVKPLGKRSRKAKGSTAKPKSAEEEPDAQQTDADTNPWHTWLINLVTNLLIQLKLTCGTGGYLTSSKKFTDPVKN